MPTFYIASRFRGPIHASHDADKTLCRKEIGSHWWLMNAEKEDAGKVTCKECLRAIGKEGNNESKR